MSKLSLKKKSNVTSLTWYLADGKKTQMLVIPEGDQFRVSFQPAKRIFVMGEAYKKIYGKRLLDFRDKDVFAFTTGDIESIIVDGIEYRKVQGDFYTRAELERKKQLPEDQKSSVRPHFNIQSFTVDLEFAKTEDFLELNSPESLRNT